MVRAGSSPCISGSGMDQRYWAVSHMLDILEFSVNTHFPSDTDNEPHWCIANIGRENKKG